MRPTTPSAGLVIAVIALVLATTGISVGATATRSDGTKSTGASGAAHDAASRRGPRGPRGLRGPRGYDGADGLAGAAGPQGPAGLLAIKRVDGQKFTLAPGQNTVDAAGLGGFVATCPAGMYVIGTGFEADFGGIWNARAYTTFVGGFAVNYGSINGDYQLQAVCAQLPPGASAASAARRTAERAAFTAEVARLRTLAEQGHRP